MNGSTRIEIIVLDIVERLRLPQRIRIKRNEETLYTGSVISIPKELLNEKVINIYINDCGYFYNICIE